MLLAPGSSRRVWCNCVLTDSKTTARRDMSISHSFEPPRYEFMRGVPIKETAENAYDDADLNRAIQAYRFFYPTVSGAAIFKGNEEIGVVPNKVFGILDTEPTQL